MSTYAWNHERFLFAARANGINGATELARAMNARRELIGERSPIPVQTAHRYWTGAHDPMVSGPGKPAAVFELAAVLEVPVDWLTSGVTS